MTTPRIPRELLDQTAGGAPDAPPPAPTTPITRVSVHAPNDVHRVLQGPGALVVVGLDITNPGVTAHHMGAPSAMHAAAMLAASVALVRRFFGETSVRAALEMEQSITFTEDATDLGGG